MSMFRTTFAMAAAAVALSTAAEAATFSSEAAFLAATVNQRFEDFNDEPTVERPDGGTIVLDDFTISSPDARISIRPGFIFGGIDGTNFFDAFINTDAPSITFDFDMPITAFGATFDSPASGAGLGIDVGGDGTLDFTDLGIGAGQGFFGFIADAPFTSLVFGLSGLNTTFGEIFSLDDVIIGDPIPVPPAILLFGAGLAAFARRR